MSINFRGDQCLRAANSEIIKMKDEEIIRLYYRVKTLRVSQPEVVVYQYGNVAICRDRSGELVTNESALEILTEQVETCKRLLGVKRVLSMVN